MATRIKKQTKKQSERRSEPRSEEKLNVLLSDSGVGFNAEAKNLSASGTYCTVDRFISPMTKLDLKFELPDGKKRTIIKCTGVVVRVEPIATDLNKPRYHMAVFFSDVNAQDRAVIARYVRGRLGASTTNE